MALTILKGLETIHAVKNNMAFKVRASGGWQAVEYEVSCSVYRELGYRTTLWEEVDTMIQNPNANAGNEIIFDFHRLLAGFVKHDPPYLNAASGIKKCQLMNQRAMVVVSEKINGIIGYTNKWPNIHFIKAGIDKRAYAKGQRLSDWQQKGLFLTHQPRRKVVTDYQPEWLYWCMNAGSQHIKLNGQVEYKDGSVGNLPNTYTILNVEGQDVVMYSTGFRQLGLELDPLAAEIKKWRVWIEQDSDGTRLSEIMEYELACCDMSQQDRYYVFENSLGGYDSLHTIGELTVGGAIEKQSAQRVLGPYAEAYDRELISFDIQHRHTFKQHISYKNRVEYDWILDLLRSEDVYRLGDLYPNPTVDMDWVPIDIEKGTFEHYKDRQFMQPLQFAYAEALQHQGL